MLKSFFTLQGKTPIFHLPTRTFRLQQKLCFHVSTLLKARSNSRAIVKKLELIKKERELSNTETSKYIEKELDTQGLNLIDPTADLSQTFIEYMKLNHTLFNKTLKHLKRLEKELTTQQYTEDEKFHKLFEFFSVECAKEVERLSKMGIENLDNMLSEKHLQDLQKLNETLETDPNENILMEKFTKDFFQSAESSSLTDTQSNGGLPVLKMTTTLFSLLEVLLKTDSSSSIHKIMSPMDYVQIFEISKNIPINFLKMKGFYLSGTLIYNIKNSQGKSLTMDPINESFFIDSLMAQGQYKKALILFKNKLLKVNQKWWMEMGMMLYLKTNQLNKFNKLFKYTVAKFGEDQINVKPVKLAILGNLKVKNTEMFYRYLNFYKNKVSQYGLIPNEVYLSNINSTNVQFASEEEGNVFLNKFDGIRDKNFFSVVSILIYNNHLKEAQELLAMYENDKPGFDPHNPRYQINRLHAVLKSIVTQSIGCPYSKATIPQMLQELQVSCELLQDSPNSIPVLQNLMIKSVMGLAKNPVYSDDIASLFTSDLQAQILGNEQMSDGEKYKTIVMFLLKSNCIAPALNILSILENSEAVTTHIYAEFIRHFTFQITNDKKPHSKTHAEACKTVDAFLEKIEKDTSIVVSNSFIDSLIQFFTATDQWDKLVPFVNKYLESLISNNQGTNCKDQLSLSPSVMNKVFHVYGTYYHKTASLPLFKDFNKLDTKSNFTYHIDSLLRFCFFEKNMVPNTQIYQTIVKSLVLSQNWTSLIAVILYCVENYDLRLAEPTFKYILKGIKFSYLGIEMKTGSESGSSWKEMKLQKSKALKKINQAIHSKEIMKFVTMENSSNETVTICSILEYLMDIHEYKQSIIEEKLVNFGLSKNLINDDLNLVKKSSSNQDLM